MKAFGMMGLMLFLFFSSASASGLKSSPMKERVANTIHHWTALLDQVTGNPDGFQKLLAPEFLNLQVEDKTVQSFSEFSEWLKARSEHVQISLHRVEHLKVEVVEPLTYRATFEYHWQGQSHDGQPLLSRRRQEWLLVVGPDGKAKVQQIQGKYLLPLLDTGTRIRC